MSKEDATTGIANHKSFLPSEDSIGSGGYLSSLWHLYKVELIIGLVFAVAFGLLYEGLRNFRKRLKKRNSSLRLFASAFWEKNFAGNRHKPINNREIEKSIRSNLAGLTETSIVFSIDKRKILTNKDESHFEINGYHFDRFLTVLPVLDGGELFFVEACRGIGEIFKAKDLDCLIYLDKPTDLIFCREIVDKKLPKCTKVYGLGYNTQTENPKVVYRENDSLEGQNVAIVTTLALSERPLVDLTEFVRNQGAELVGVAILFDAIYNLVDLQKILGVQVISAISVDLKPSKSDHCSWCTQKPNVKKLGFHDY